MAASSDDEAMLQALQLTPQAPGVAYEICLDADLRLTKYGDWIHKGVTFENTKLIRLFNRSVRYKAAADKYFLQVGIGIASFTCEDTGFFVTILHDDAQPWEVSLSNELRLPVDPQALSLGTEGQIYLALRDGARARFSRAAFQALAAHVIDENHLRMGDYIIHLRAPA